MFWAVCAQPHVEAGAALGFPSHERTVRSRKRVFQPSVRLVIV
jgi:hypothetical protein